MAEYWVSPRAVATTWEPVPVALVAATTKTVLQVATPAGSDIRINGWGVSFDGVTGSAVPVICQLLDGDVAASVGTSMTPDTWDPGYPASSCIGGAALTGYNFGTEGAMTVVHALDSQHVHPQSGYGLWWPDNHRPRVTVSRFLRIRCKAPVAVNVIPWINWQE